MSQNPGRTYAIGQAFRFKGKSDYAFQNFNVGGKVKLSGNTYQFLPFGFSGITVARNGDNVDASIVLPNCALSQAFALQALEEEWLAVVRVGSFDPGSPSKFAQVLYEYWGVVSSGGWDDTSVRLILNSVLDAVTGDVPHRVIEQENCGPLPISANLRLQ